MHILYLDNLQEQRKLSPTLKATSVFRRENLKSHKVMDVFIYFFNDSDSN